MTPLPLLGRTKRQRDAFMNIIFWIQFRESLGEWGFTSLDHGPVHEIMLTCRIDQIPKIYLTLVYWYCWFCAMRERAGIPIPKNFSSPQTEITHVHAMSNFYSFVLSLGSTWAPAQYLTLDGLNSVANPQTLLGPSFRPFHILLLWYKL